MVNNYFQLKIIKIRSILFDFILKLDKNDLLRFGLKINQMSEMNELNIDQPSLINIKLFLHQLKSIENMENLEESGQIMINASEFINTKIGLLCDIPGYGKSLSILGLIAKTLKKIPIEETIFYEKVIQYNELNTFSHIKISPLQKTDCSLVLVNISLLSQWIAELNRTLLRFIAIYNKNDIENIDTSKYDVILISNNIYNLFSQVYRKKIWKRFIIDEPMSLKIPSMELTYANFYWLVTSTPNELYIKKRNGFINDLLPDNINHLIIKNEDCFVKNSYEMPVTSHIYYKCQGNISKLFSGLVSHNILEMMEAGNIQGVFSSFCVEDKKITLIDLFKERKSKRIEELNNIGSMTKGVIEKIQIIIDQLKTLDLRINRYVNENNCIICKKQYNKAFVLSCCQNIFCGECYVKNEECLLCKSNDVEIFPISNVFNDETKADFDIKTNNNKMTTLLEIVGDTVGKKILIFSNHNESFTIIKKFLDSKNLSYLELRGTKQKRDNTIDLYKSGNINILLLNTIGSGAGLNLQETTDIIMYHNLQEYQKIQVIGRACRIGRKSQLNVHYLE